MSLPHILPEEGKRGGGGGREGERERMEGARERRKRGGMAMTISYVALALFPSHSYKIWEWPENSRPQYKIQNKIQTKIQTKIPIKNELHM